MVWVGGGEGSGWYHLSILEVSFVILFGDDCMRGFRMFA